MEICDKCVGKGCAWSTYQEDLIRHWLECRQRGRSFGEIGCVKDCNRRARKICYIKCNSYVDVHPDTPCPPCVVVGLSYLFPSDAFQDGTELPNFMENNRRDGHGQSPSKRTNVTVHVPSEALDDGTDLTNITDNNGRDGNVDSSFKRKRVSVFVDITKH